MYKNFLVNFHKGLRRSGSPRIFEDGECSIALDCYFDKIGNIYSRKYLNTVTEFDNSIKTIFPYSKKTIVHTENGSIYSINGDLISTGIGINKISFVEYNDILYFGTKRYKTTVQDSGNDAPTTDPTSSTINSEITDCSSFWTAAASVTASVDEHDYVSNPDDVTDITSCKLEIASSFTTGNIATRAIGSKDLSSYTHIGLWIKSDTNINSGVLQLMLDNTAACASPLETLNIPALTINEWTWVVLELADPSLLTAIISIGLKAASDPGEIIVRLDRIIAMIEGELDGAYYYKYSYVDSNDKESGFSDSSIVINLKQEQASVVVTASSDSKVNYINLYRLGGVLTDWYYVTQVDNTTQTIVDNANDNDLVTLAEDDVNDKPPDGLTFLVEHYERLIGAKDNTYLNSIQFTKEYEPEYWGNALSQQYLISNKDACMGLLSWGRYVIFCKKNRIYVCEGADPTTWHIRKSDSCYGNLSPWALQFYKAPIILTYSGLSFFDGNVDITFSDRVKDWFKENKSNLEYANAAIFDDKYYLAIHNKTLIYDFILKIFYEYDLSLSEICYNYLNDKLYAGYGKNLVTLDNDINLNSETINFKVKSKAYPLNDVPGYPGNLKDFIINLHSYNQIVTLNVYIDEELKDSVNITSSKLTRIRRKFDATLKGNFAEFELVSTGTKRIEIQSPIVINPKDNE